MAHASSGLLPDQCSAEHCRRCHVRLSWRLKPTRAELDDAAQPSQAELMKDPGLNYVRGVSTFLPVV